jgi:hypothetical protein
MNTAWKNILCIGLVSSALMGCADREERVADAIKDGNKAVANEKNEAKKEVASAVEDSNAARQQAVNEVAEAQRLVEQ